MKCSWNSTTVEGGPDGDLGEGCGSCWRTGVPGPRATSVREWDEDQGLDDGEPIAAFLSSMTRVLNIPNKAHLHDDP